MQLLILILAFSLAILSSSEDCKPLYLRIFYSPSPSPELKVDMVVMFNTFDRCADSYIRVEYLNSKEEYPCKEEKIEIKGQYASYLEQYVQTCNLEIDSSSSVTEFRYKVEGGNKLPEESTQWQTVQLSSETLPFRILVAANMDILNDKLYPSFAHGFNKLIKLRDEELKQKQGQNNFRINGIAINGGFAAGLSEKKGQNFNKIMRMISQYSSRWPIMLNLGPTEVTNKQDFALIEKCFVLGGIGNNTNRTAVQGYSFARKANLAFIETSSQYFSEDGSETADFNRTLSTLGSFFSKNQENGNEFNIVLNHYALFCDDTPNNEIYNCARGAKNLASLKKKLTDATQNNAPTDLYIGAYQNNYERSYPYRKERFMTLEASRYNRGDFINLNEGTGGYDLIESASTNKKAFTAVKTAGRPGFGILTIKGNGELRKKNASDIISIQTAARKIYDTHSIALDKSSQISKSILSEAYISNENLNEMQLFLLNYKHITINPSYELIVEDVFRIVTNPQKVERHQLHVHSQ